MPSGSESAAAPSEPLRARTRAPAWTRSPTADLGPRCAARHRRPAADFASTPRSRLDRSWCPTTLARGLDGQHPCAVRLDDHPPVLVGPVDGHAGRAVERCERLGPRVPVLVVATAGDDCDPRPQLAQLGREARILGAMVGDLENLHL